jgi:hypothetical protein
MPLTTLTPLPFLPIPGKFDLNTFLPGSSDYEILARVVETYNSAVKQFNEIITFYSQIEQIQEKFQIQLDDFENKVNTENEQFKSDITTQQNNYQKDIDAKIAQLNKTVQKCYDEVQKLINGEYIETYVQALATWIDNNLQVMVSKIVKYVWFEINEDGYFIAWIPDTWDFIDFDTDMNPDSEDYGKLALLWEPEVVQ